MDDSKLGDEHRALRRTQSATRHGCVDPPSGWADHYAAAAMYLRLNGVTPPSAQTKH